MATKSANLKVMHIISADLWAGAEVQAYTLLKHLRDKCELAVIVLNPGRLADELNRLNIAVTLLDESKLSSLELLKQMRKAMLAFRPDIVHTHRQKENILGSVANAASIRAKCVRTSHGAPEFKPQGIRKLQVLLDRVVGSYLQAAVIAVSKDLSEQLGDQFPARKIKVIHNGVDAEALKAQVAPADFKARAPGARHIGIIGRLEPVKRVDLFLEAAEHLAKALPDEALQFHIIGEGSLRSQLEAQANRSPLAEHIHFHGHRGDVPSCLASLDALVMCSDHEGTPMTALEALALGTPLVGHYVGGLKEILEPFSQAQVTQHSAEGYAAAVSRCVKSQAAFKVELPDLYMAERNASETLLLYQKL